MISLSGGVKRKVSFSFGLQKEISGLAYPNFFIVKFQKVGWIFCWKQINNIKTNSIEHTKTDLEGRSGKLILN